MNLNRVKKIAGKYSHLFISVYIYGSTIRNEQDEYSDIDIVLVRETSADFFDRVREVIKFVLELGQTDILIYTPDEINILLKEPGRGFLKKAVSEGVLIEGTQAKGSQVAETGRK